MLESATQNSAVNSVNQRDNPSLGDLPRPASAGFFFLDDKELDIVWAFARRKRCTPHFEDTELGNRIATSMRKRFPFPGHQWDKYLTVYLKPGQDIPAHEHKRHAVLWYPEATSVLVGKRELLMSAGEMAYLEPGTTHSVPRVTVERLSVAMLVSVPASTRLIPT